MADQPDARRDAHTHDSHHVCAHGALDEHHGEVDAICLDDVSYAYDGHEALHDVTLHIETGCCLGVIGPNGGGKTTLLRIILGLLGGYTGRASVLDMAPAEVCRRGDVIGYVPQHHEFERRFPVSVRQVVRMGLVGRTGLLRRTRRDDLDYAEQIMQQVGVADLVDRPIGDLSSGQQQRVFIARALACRPKILLLDEPLVGVDLAGQQQFAELIHQLHDALGLTLVVVSHDLRAVAGSCGKVAVLNRSIHYHDSPAGLTADLLHEIFRHDIAPILGAGG